MLLGGSLPMVAPQQQLLMHDRMEASTKRGDSARNASALLTHFGLFYRGRTHTG
jgi:hypothetical protein